MQNPIKISTDNNLFLNFFHFSKEQLPKTNYSKETVTIIDEESKDSADVEIKATRPTRAGHSSKREIQTKEGQPTTPEGLSRVLLRIGFLSYTLKVVKENPSPST